MVRIKGRIMSKDRINHNALTHLVEAGAVSIVVAKAMGDTWALAVQVGDTNKVVMAKNSGKPRVWRKLDTLAKYLKDLGIDTFQTDVSSYDPSIKSLRRPDSANTLKQTHKSHQSLQQSAEQTQKPKPEQVKQADVEMKVNVDSEKPQAQEPVHDMLEETIEPVKLNATDVAIQKAKERWEHRRAKILQESDPRAR